MAANAPSGKPTAPQGIPYPEYVLRILFASFYPAVKMAVDFNYPLDTVKDMMTLALWREAKRKHSTINLISLIFGKSTRTVKALSARFNKGGFFAETETNLMRRVEDLLRQRPMTMDELAERLPHCNEFDSTRLAVRALLREGRIEVVASRPPAKPRYQVTASHQDLCSEVDWEARVDALYEHLEAVSETVRRRFLSDEPETAAARTFSFRATPEDMAAFRDELFAFVRKRYQELEAQAEGRDDARIYAVYTGATVTEPEEVSEDGEEDW
ncbi:MAG: hypothetical protein H6706_17320 [Myxococcales bacterium]|nr:hypothetical protein [Myxococcales bacterium]